jgi:hypothetical protein
MGEAEESEEGGVDTTSSATCVLSAASKARSTRNCEVSKETQVVAGSKDGMISCNRSTKQNIRIMIVHEMDNELVKIWNLILALSDQLQENRAITAQLRAQADVLKVLSTLYSLQTLSPTHTHSL